MDRKNQRKANWVIGVAVGAILLLALVAGIAESLKRPAPTPPVPAPPAFRVRVGEVWAPADDIIVVLKRPRLARSRSDFMGLQVTTLSVGQPFRVTGFGQGDGEEWLRVECLQPLRAEFGGGERVYARGWVRRRHLADARRIQ